MNEASKYDDSVKQMGMSTIFIYISTWIEQKLKRRKKTLHQNAKDKIKL